MKLRTKRRLYLVGGALLGILGIVGLFLPILQGALFLMIALVLLARAHPRFRLLKTRFRKRHPKYADLAERAETRAGEIVRGKIFRRKTKEN